MKARKLVKKIQKVLVPVLLGLASSANGQVESGRLSGTLPMFKGPGCPMQS
jgi:hypothetical protein